MAKDLNSSVLRPRRRDFGASEERAVRDPSDSFWKNFGASDRNVPRSRREFGGVSYQRWTRNKDGRRPSLTKVLHQRRDVLLWEA